MARIQPLLTILFFSFTTVASFGQSIEDIQKRQTALDWEGAEAQAKDVLQALEGPDRLAYLETLGNLPLPNRLPFWQEGLRLIDSLSDGDSLQVLWRWKTGQTLASEDIEAALPYWEGLENTAYWGQILLQLAEKRPSSPIYLEQAIQFLSREKHTLLLAKAYFLELQRTAQPFRKKYLAEKSLELLADLGQQTESLLLEAEILALQASWEPAKSALLSLQVSRQKLEQAWGQLRPYSPLRKPLLQLAQQIWEQSVALYQQQYSQEAQAQYFEQGLRLALETRIWKKRALLWPNRADIRADSLLLEGQTTPNLAIWQARLAEESPSRYAASYAPLPTFSLAQLRSKLSAGEEFLLYYTAQEESYLLAADAEQLLGFWKLGRTEDLRQATTQLAALLAQKTEQPDKVYLQQAHSFYKRFLALGLTETKSKLQLYLDGPLWQLPFEALLRQPVTEEKSYAELPYLFKEQELSYQFLPIDSSLQKASFGKNVLAIDQRAPAMGLLPSSGFDVLFQRFRGSFYRAKEGKLSDFKRLGSSAEYSLIHLALAQENIERPYLFGKDSLSAWALSQLPLKTALLYFVALPERQATAEELIFWRNGFAQNGLSSLLLSRWPKSPEAEEAFLSIFYDLLAKGYHKEEAFREAQLSLLLDPQWAAPHYWSAYLYLGDRQTMALGKRSFFEQYWLYSILASFSLLALLIFVWRINRIDLGRNTTVND